MKGSAWYQHSRSDIQTSKPNLASSLDDLDLDRESERRFTKKPSKVFRDWLRWEQHQLKQMMADLQRQQQEIIANATYDPLELETVIMENSVLSDVGEGEVLRDPKRNYSHPLLLQIPSIGNNRDRSKEGR